MQDIRLAFRTLRRNSGFAAIAVLILGLAVGAATAIFGIVNSVLLKPLPYDDPSRLVAVTRVLNPDTANLVSDTVALNDVWVWREQSTSFASMTAFFFTRTSARVDDTAFLPNTVFMDSELLPMLGVSLAIGTNFDDVSAFDNTVIISHAFWQRAFGGERDAIGKLISVNGQFRSVRGVLPVGFEVPRTDVRFYRGPVDLFLPAVQTFRGGNDWGIARLADGVSIEQAQAELRGVIAALNESGLPNDGWTARLTPLSDERTRSSRQPLLILLVIGAVLLLIGCTNLVNLLLAHNTVRMQEVAVRKTVGATSGRLIRQQLTESLCLAVLGCTVGIVIAAIGIRVFGALLPVRLPIIEGVTLDTRVIGFGFAISIAATLIVSAGPVLSSTMGGLRLESNARARIFPRTQRVLTIVQIGLSVGLLASATVLSYSLWRLYNVDRGFDGDGVLALELDVPGSRNDWVRFVSSALDEVASIPGVSTVGYITFLPPETRAAAFAPFRIDGSQLDVPALAANTLATSMNYFEIVSMSVTRGRGFDETDRADSPPVAVVNEAFARAFLPQTDPIGIRMVSEFDTRLGKDETSREIIGVVSDTRDRGLNQAPAPTVYVPYGQGTLPYGAITLRAQITPDVLIPEIRRRLSAINPNVPLTAFQTLDARIWDSLRGPRLYALLAVVCATMAVLFIAVGVYGVVAYSVSIRTVELGVRMALGSTRTRIMRLVLRQGAIMALAGAGLGLLLAWGTMRALSSLLFEVDPLNPALLAVAALLVVIVALLAAFVPTLQACKLNLTTALRYEG